jgi:predicted DNA-binding protein
VTDTKVSKQVGIRLPNEMYDAAAKLAQEQRRPLGWILRDFIEEGLAREAKMGAKSKTAKR